MVLNITGSILGALPPFLGMLTGVPSGPLGPFLGTGGPFGGPGGIRWKWSTNSNYNSSRLGIKWRRNSSDIVNTADNYISDMIEGLASTISGSINDFISAAENKTGETITNLSEYLENFLDGTLDGETCLNTHLAHQVTPPDSNGSFNHIAGELKSNPRPCVLSNGGMNRLAINFK